MFSSILEFIEGSGRALGPWTHLLCPPPHTHHLFTLSFQCQVSPFQNYLFKRWKLKRHPGVLGRTKVNMSLKIISNIIILQTLSERKWWKQYHVIAPGDQEYTGFFYCLCTSVWTNFEKIPPGTAVRIRERWKIHSKFTEISCIDTVMVSGAYCPASLWFWQDWLPEGSAEGISYRTVTCPGLQGGLGNVGPSSIDSLMDTWSLTLKGIHLNVWLSLYFENWTLQFSLVSALFFRWGCPGWGTEVSHSVALLCRIAITFPQPASQSSPF